MWLKAKKRVAYPLVPEIMIDDWVNKGHTNLHMFSVVGEQIRSLSNKQSKLNSRIQQHPKIAIFLPFVDTNSHLTTKPYNFDIRCQSNSESYDWHGFLVTKFRGGQNFVLTVGGCGWLAGLSHIKLPRLKNWKKDKKSTMVVHLLSTRPKQIKF